LIKPELLEKMLIWCTQNSVIPQIVFDDGLNSKSYFRILKKYEFNRICFSSKNWSKHSDIIVLNGYQIIESPNIILNTVLKVSNIVLRINKEELSSLDKIFYSIWKQFDRLNLILLDIETLSEAELNLYKAKINEISHFVSGFSPSDLPEISFLTDRLHLKDMRNCNAGIDHITVDYNGNLYLCPGFVTDKSYLKGKFTNFPEFEIHNEELLHLDYSPICSVCDCFQCKRCFYLNHIGTFEINTPTHQQCNISHQEREASRKLMFTNKSFPINVTLKDQLEYNDPIEIVEEKRIRIPIDSLPFITNYSVSDPLYSILDDLISKYDYKLLIKMINDIKNEKDKN
jgi:CXXX repeat peptide maturase